MPDKKADPKQRLAIFARVFSKKQDIVKSEITTKCTYHLVQAENFIPEEKESYDLVDLETLKKDGVIIVIKMGITQ